MKSLWNTIKDLFAVLPKGAKPFYMWYSVITGALAILDTIALGLIAFAITPIASGTPIRLPLIGEISENGTIWLIAIICILFISKGILAVILHWFATRRFARYELEVGNQLFDAYARSEWEERSRLSTAEVTRIVDMSMANTNMSFILPLSQVPGNALTFISVLAVLIIAQPLTALIAFVYLAGLLFIMLLVVTRKTRKAGNFNREYTYRVATIMTEMVDALKEITLRGKLDEIGGVINDNRRVATTARANISFLAIVPKYVLEAALIGGFVLVGGAAFVIGGVQEAIVAVGLFAATGFRMIPAMNAVQGGFNVASAHEAFARDVISELQHAKSGRQARFDIKDTEEIPSRPQSMQLEHVSFQYLGTEKPVLKSIELEIPFGTRLAVVGPSGAGKSTLIDMLLGLSTPTSGSISIDGVPLEGALNQWRNRVGYVPQRVSLFDASIAQNVALTWSDDFDESRVRVALERAHLSELLERPGGIHSNIGERGFSISGGQQQRLGIARALYSDPLVLVLDEATSSLDTNTESKVTASLRELKGETTFVTVAHRLATIRDYEQICYLDDGHILASGTFDEVVEQLPDFRIQAQLAGLL